MNKLIKLFTMITLMTSLGHAVAATGDFVLGKDYEVVAPEATTEPMVEEFFNYACGACYGTEAFVNKLKADNPGLKFKAVPVELHPSWKIYVKAYFIGEKLGVLDKSHAKLFHRIHVEKKHFTNDAEMKSFFLGLGVDEKAYDEIANSTYWLNLQMRQAKQYAFKNKVSSTPAFLVNKKFKLNRSELGSYERIEQAIIDFSGLKK